MYVKYIRYNQVNISYALICHNSQHATVLY